MDLTYMPGELDYKQEKKGNGSEIKREHDSVDDFEHLDPESSPVDGQFKTFTTVETIKINPESAFEKAEKDFGEKEHLVELVSQNDNASKPSQQDYSNLKSDSDDLLSGVSSDLKQNIDLVNVKSNFSDFDTANKDFLSSTAEKKLESSNLDTHFIAAEIASNTDKTDADSFVENKPKTQINKLEEFSVVQDSDNKKAEDEKFSSADFDSSKPMKADDALSQYEIKPDKKEQTKSENLIDEDLPISNIALPSENDKTELKLVTESSKLVPQPENQEEVQIKSSKTSKLPEDDMKKESKEESIGDTKPFIAICPGKPSTASKEPKKSTAISDIDDIVIGPEDVFKRIGLDAWFTPERLHPKVEALVYWRDPKKSGVVFGSIMAVLLSLCYMSLISVVAYFSLLALTGTICFRIYKNILQAVQKNDEGHPFKEFLDIELSLPQDKVREVVDTAVVHVNAGLVELRRLFLVEDLIDSIKFGVCLWCFTYVGAIFNGMTIVILSFVALFTVPKIYENNKASIDQYIELGRSKVADITSKVKAAVPIGKKEPEKAKEQ